MNNTNAPFDRKDIDIANMSYTKAFPNFTDFIIIPEIKFFVNEAGLVPVEIPKNMTQMYFTFTNLYDPTYVMNIFLNLSLSEEMKYFEHPTFIRYLKYCSF